MKMEETSPVSCFLYDIFFLPLILKKFFFTEHFQRVFLPGLKCSAVFTFIQLLGK